VHFRFEGKHVRVRSHAGRNSRRRKLARAEAELKKSLILACDPRACLATGAMGKSQPCKKVPILNHAVPISPPIIVLFFTPPPPPLASLTLLFSSSLVSPPQATPIWATLHPEDVASSFELYQTSWKTLREWKTTARHLVKGEYRVITSTSTPVRLPDGRTR
jgi:hypothetical protein